MTFSLRALPAVLALAASVACCADDLKMDVHQAFEGYLPSSGSMAVTAEISNAGPDAVGVLRVEGQTFHTDYPIELPRGAHKLLFTHPTLDYGEIKYRLITDHGDLTFNYVPESKWQQTQNVLALISDSPGGLAFLRPRSDVEADRIALQDIYAKPAETPNRMVGFAGINAVMLGDGAERLDDAQVDALKLWTMTGGTLVFIGGASAPILNDPRWKPMLPASDFTTSNLKSSVLEDWGGAPVPLTTFLTGKPKWPDQATLDGSTLIKASENYGIGRVIYLSFNPLEAPLTHWSGRAAMLSKILSPAPMLSRRSFLAMFTSEQIQGTSGPVTTFPLPAGSPTPSFSSPIREDPFSTKLPSAGSIFLILGLYFLCVIPINFYVLKKLGRAELAWYTAPILSLVFAGVLFSRAQSLYNSKLSTASQGLVVAQEGQPTAVFAGTSEIFTPVAGSYDLKFDGVDSVGMIDTEPYGRMSNSQTMELDPVDDGQIRVPHMQTNNLAFREITYRQKIDVTGWFTMHLLSDGHTLQLANNSPYELQHPYAYEGEIRKALPNPFKPGDRLSIDMRGGVKSASDNLSIGRFVMPGQTAIQGMIVGFRPGPQVGSDVKARSQITFVFMGGANP